jgi:hypothetical protein
MALYEQNSFWSESTNRLFDGLMRTVHHHADRILELTGQKLFGLLNVLGILAFQPVADWPPSLPNVEDLLLHRTVGASPSR